jgi:hypothetical protein
MPKRLPSKPEDLRFSTVCHALEQLSKFAKAINYKIGSFAQQLRLVKTCGEAHGDALRTSSCNDTVDRVFDDPTVFGWKIQVGNRSPEDVRRRFSLNHRSAIYGYIEDLG